MKKYIWKCESNDCGKEFVAENPNSCPECGGDDIFIIKERGSPLKKILIAIVAIIVVGLVWCNWCNIFPKEDGPKMENGNMTYNLKIEESKNYFEITGSDEKLGLFVEDENGDRLYHKKNKFYPCKSGDFYVKWEEDSKIKVKGKTEFNFELETPHKNACDEQLEIYDAAANPSTCTYTIRTNMDDNAQLEVGLKKGGKYRKGKLVWTKEEAGSASYFYVRIKGGESQRKRIEECTPPQDTAPPAPPADEVVASFNLCLSDIKHKRQQFTDMFLDMDPEVYFDGKTQELQDFTLHVRNEKNYKKYHLIESDITYNTDKTKIIKLKITTQ